MCGIAGWFTHNNNLEREKDSSRIKNMNNAIVHRGPDDAGYVIRENAVLGHVRLSIIDLDTGQQPMSYHHENIHIVFNGEIYNYKELRQNLKNDGYTFNTSSDTEVILGMYLKYKLDAFQYLRGMFAIGIWDENKQNGLLVRDSFGIKPLFYHINEQEELIFASEAKAILARDGKKGLLDVNSLHLLMNFRYLPGHRSMFKDINQVGPGEIIEWSPHSKIKKYKFIYIKEKRSEDILNCIKESVELHLTADVEVGTYLSGGIDSACISKFANDITSHKLRSFTLNIGDDPDEANNARSTAKVLDIDNVVGECSYNITDIIPKLIWHLEVPKVNALQTFKVAELAASQVKVVMSGLGGDELFLGYNAHNIIRIVNNFSEIFPDRISIKFADLVLPIFKNRHFPLWSEYERVFQMCKNLGNWPRVYGILRNVWDNDQLRKKIYGPRMLDENLENAFSFLESTWPDIDDPVQAMAKYEFGEKMVNDLLWQEDRCSMAHGLEVRVPFVDPVLVNKVNVLTRTDLMPNGKPKGYMKDILKDVLPNEILSRPKSGFQVNAVNFYEENLSELENEYLSHEKLIQYGLFNPNFVKEVIRYRKTKRLRWHYFILYMMIMSHIWIEIFEKPNNTFRFNT